MPDGKKTAVKCAAARDKMEREIEQSEDGEKAAVTAANTGLSFAGGMYLSEYHIKNQF